MSILKTLQRVPGVETIQGLAQDNIISPAKTGINAVGKYLTGFPLIGTVASGIGQMFEGDSPVDAFNRLNYSVSGNPNLKSFYGDSGGNMLGKDPYGINTVSALGDYNKFAVNQINKLNARPGDLDPFLIDKLSFYENVVQQEELRQLQENAAREISLRNVPLYDDFQTYNDTSYDTSNMDAQGNYDDPMSEDTE